MESAGRGEKSYAEWLKGDRERLADALTEVGYALMKMYELGGGLTRWGLDKRIDGLAVLAAELGVPEAAEDLNCLRSRARTRRELLELLPGVMGGRGRGVAAAGCAVKRILLLGCDNCEPGY